MPRRRQISLPALVVLLLGWGTLPAASAQEAAKPAGPLKIVDALFENYDGFPQQQLQLKTGSDAVVNFRVEGFGRQPGLNASGLPQHTVHLRYEVEFRDPTGVLVQPVFKGKINTVLQLEDEHWSPLIRWSGHIPSAAPPGNYPILIRVYDDIGKQQANAKLLLSVTGEPVAPSSVLAVQQIEFAGTPSGPWTPHRVFAVSDPVYVRYNVAGFQVAAAHLVWVEQDWAVLDSQGKVIALQQNATSNKSQDFYPPRFLPTTFDFELNNPKPGDYTLRVTVRDRIANRQITAEAPFGLRP